jgi:hypothetical protein
VTVDGLSIKDSKLVTANSVVTTNVTDANITSGKIADDAVTLAKMASGTDGNIISYDASGNPVAVATGSAGQILTSAGAGAPPTFAAPAAAGKVLQVVNGNFGTEQNINSTSYVDTAITLNITLSATSSKVLVLIAPNVEGYFNANDYRTFKLKILRDSTVLQYKTNQIGATSNTSNNYVYGAVDGTVSYLDSPSSTSQLTYKVQGAVSNTGNNCNIRFNGTSSTGHSTITLMEISG